MKLNSIDSEEGDENVRQEIDKRVEQDARDAYESLRSQGKLVAATFATQSLGLSLVLSRFAPTPHQLKRKELTPQKTSLQLKPESHWLLLLQMSPTSQYMHSVPLAQEPPLGLV